MRICNGLKYHGGLAVMLGMMCCSIGCSTPKASPPTTFPSQAREWHDGTLDRVDFYAPFKVTDYAGVVVKPFDTEQTPLPTEDDNTYDAVTSTLQSMDTKIADGILRVLGGRTLVVPESRQDTLNGKVLLVEGKVLRLDPGSNALRFWVGYGAGSAGISIEGAIKDSESGKALASFSNEAGWYGGVADYNIVCGSLAEQEGFCIGHLIWAFDDRPEDVEE